MSQLPETEANIQLAIDVRLEARLALGATAQLAKLRAYAGDAQLRAEAISDRKRALAASMQSAQALIYVGTPKEALAAAEGAFRYAVEGGVQQVQAATYYILGQANYMAGNFRRGMELMTEAEGLLRGSARLARLGTTGTTLTLVKVLRATSVASMGEFQTAAEVLREAAEISKQTQRPYDLAAVAYGAGYTALLQGRFADAVTTVEPAMEVVKKHEIVFFLPVLGNLLGQAYVVIGRLEDGLRALRDANAIAVELGHLGARIGTSLSLGVARLAAGDLGGAEELVVPCLESARSRGYRGIHVNAARYLAVLLAKRGESRAAVHQLFEEAIEVAMTIEARPSAALAKLAQAEFFTELGEADEARATVFAALQEFVRMDMTIFAKRAQRLAGAIGAQG